MSSVSESVVECGAPGPSLQCSILIPALNEVDNIDALMRRTLAAVERAGLNAEILVIDGGSTDGTQEQVRLWGAPVRLIESGAKQGLAGDILLGAAAARADVVLVMDADLSHPPEALESLVKPVLEGACDLALGSRHVAGGSTPGWPWRRRLMSRLATALAWPLTSVRDPMSGFFAVRRERLLALGREASGFKIALEVLARSDDSLRVIERPITFRDREKGVSKLGLKDSLAYLQQAFALAGGAVSTAHALRFGVVGLLGLVVDLLIFNALLLGGADLTPAHIASFAAATLFNYTLNARWAFADTAGASVSQGWRQYMRFLVVCLLALMLRGAVLEALVATAGVSPQLAILPAIAAAALVNFIGSAFFVFSRSARTTPAIRWRVLALAVTAYSVALRLCYLGIVDLIPEEAYYWMYSERLSIGYLDHPPMVSWLIWLSRSLLGDTELAVRLPALVCWFIAAAFMFLFARNLLGKTVAHRSLILLAALPIYFTVGMIMTPDAPLYAAWAGSLYFLERALLGERRRAWWGAGACLGLGMLSKYTIALLGPAILAFMLIHKPSRRWLLRPEPYLAAALAALIFSPVITWNAVNDWASFAFQGSRRWSGNAEFAPHLLLGAAVLLLTPLGLIGAFMALAPRWAGGEPLPAKNHLQRPDARKLFATCFTLAPLAVFILHSLRADPKLNWTGPVWLAVIPLLASGMAPIRDHSPRGLVAFGQRLWKPTIVAALLVYSSGLYYVLLGMPGAPPMNGMSLPVAWQEMVQEIEQIEERLQRQSRDQPLVVGLRKYSISSEYAFYDPKHDGPAESSGRHLLGDSSLMWAYWKPAAAALGKNVVMVDFEKKDLLDPAIQRRFTRLSSVNTQVIEKNGRVVGRFFYRIGYDYHGS